MFVVNWISVDVLENDEILFWKRLPPDGEYFFFFVMDSSSIGWRSFVNVGEIGLYLPLMDNFFLMMIFKYFIDFF